MARASAHRWEFRARFRRQAFGWRSQPAIKRVKEAVAAPDRFVSRMLGSRLGLSS